LCPVACSRIEEAVVYLWGDLELKNRSLMTAVKVRPEVEESLRESLPERALQLRYNLIEGRWRPFKACRALGISLGDFVETPII
jgi:hypothetical protein